MPDAGWLGERGASDFARPSRVVRASTGFIATPGVSTGLGGGLAGIFESDGGRGVAGAAAFTGANAPGDGVRGGGGGGGAAFAGANAPGDVIGRAILTVDGGFPSPAAIFGIGVAGIAELRSTCADTGVVHVTALATGADAVASDEAPTMGGGGGAVGTRLDDGARFDAGERADAGPDGSGGGAADGPLAGFVTPRDSRSAAAWSAAQNDPTCAQRSFGASATARANTFSTSSLTRTPKRRGVGRDAASRTTDANVSGRSPSAIGRSRSSSSTTIASP